MVAKRQLARAFPSPGKLLRVMFLGALVFIAIVSFPVLIYLMVMEPEPDRKRFFAYGCLIAVVVGCVSRFLIYLQSTQTRCPLCMANMFHSQRCRKHRDSSKYPLFSYLGSMILDLFFTGRFICMYCGTPFRIWK